ncbi:MAG: deoxyguanosinetriphosphate triphosphohydrolase [Proteobacteria bacterium]|jgi:dGTPase|nr:deoxyguanosinetriphosphate triphosphohydrolase [Alphaproteobacteria bacterium]NCC02705.1 deoxyguanosinetriphosphate triphosphohydrolase [Pseudomonadota bacterium]
MTKYLQDSKGELAVFATRAEETRGRLIFEPPSETRTEFQRDRDRIVHSGGFRKLRNKTQVFIENEGDYYRTRMTHSLEVAQIACSAARALGLNEDLTDAIALAHDLGHTCFGHAGESALAALMEPYGGFSHNEQTLRVLTQQEHKYLDFDGLNLTWETLEGIVKHNGPLLPLPEGKRLPLTIEEFNGKFDLELNRFAGPEAQLASLADDIAYNSHDIDDGYRAGFFSFEDLMNLPLFGPILEDLMRHHPEAEKRRLVSAVVRQVIGTMVTDMLDTARANIARLKPQSAQDIRKAKEQVINFSFAMQGNIRVLRDFLRKRMYSHSHVNRVCSKSERIVSDMFTFLMERPDCLPNSWFALLEGCYEHDTAKARVIADYIAGMTDRFAVQEHRRLFSTETLI